MNSLGPIRVTKTLLDADKLKEGAKLIFISSRVGSIEDNGSGTTSISFTLSKI